MHWRTGAHEHGFREHIQWKRCTRKSMCGGWERQQELKTLEASPCIADLRRSNLRLTHAPLSDEAPTEFDEVAPNCTACVDGGTLQPRRCITRCELS